MRSTRSRRRFTIQEPVEALAAGGADEALGEPVRRSHRRLDDLEAFAGKDGVELAGELAVAVADQEAKRRSPLLECPRELAGPLGHPSTGFAVQPARSTRRLPSSMKKSTYSRCNEIVSTVKKSTASMLEACARRKAPGLPASVRGAWMHDPHVWLHCDLLHAVADGVAKVPPAVGDVGEVDEDAVFGPIDVMDGAEAKPERHHHRCRRTSAINELVW